MKESYLSFLLCILSLTFVANSALPDEQKAVLTETQLVREDLSNIPPNFESKSPAKAFLFSAIMPGTGEIYTGAKRGYFQIIAEVGFIAAAIITHRQAEEMRDDYFAAVEKHVLCDDFNDDIPDKPCPFKEKWTGEDYEHATMFDNWHNVYTESDGKPLERVGPFYWDDRESVKDEDRQRDPDSQNREEALKLRNKSNSRFQLSKTFIGLVIFNHIVSAIDARIIAKIYNKRNKRDQNLSFRMIIHPNNSVESQFVFRRRF